MKKWGYPNQESRFRGAPRSSALGSVRPLANVFGSLSLLVGSSSGMWEMKEMLAWGDCSVA